MTDKLIRELAAFSDRAAADAMRKILEPIVNSSRSAILSPPGLVIKAGASPLAKTGAAVTHYVAGGVKGRIPASTDMPALVGTVNNGKFNVFVFAVSSTGALSVQMGTEGATESAIKFPAVDPKKAVVGFIIVNPAGTGNFIGGTTALDDATVMGAGGVTYMSPTGSINIS